MIGNTAREVRSFLRRGDRATRPVFIDESLDELPVISRIERRLIGVECDRCGAQKWLCISLTGLPASGPHQERILRAEFSR